MKNTCDTSKKTSGDEVQSKNSAKKTIIIGVIPFGY